MKIQRKIEVESGSFEVGDVIAFELTTGEPVEAMAMQQTETGMVFCLVDCLKEEQSWGLDTREGYKGSHIRKVLTSEILETFPEEVRRLMIPDELGDLLSLPSEKEIFGENYFSEEEPGEQWEPMKDRRNRIAYYGSKTGNRAAWWLRSVSSASNAAIVNSNGLAASYGTSYALGVRPRFLLRQSASPDPDRGRQEQNQPLTFEELEQLEGCPVWVEANHAFIEHSGWALISYFEDFGKERGVNFVTSEHSEFFLIKDFIGITWNAYRQPYKKAEPKPDPEEYPVHCGCGGKAYVYKCEVEIDNPWTLMCEECGIMTKNFPNRAAAVKAWNKAMGANNANEA